MLRRVYISTYGCQMNVRDSEEVIGLLLEKGYTLADSEETADVILYNTCAVREHAEDRVWSNVGALKTLKGRRPEVIIGVMGCMAKAQRGKIFARMPHVDFISGPAQLYEVPELIESIYEERRPMMAIAAKRRQEFQAIAYHTGQVSALVTILEGCDKVCSYCIVPYTRGPEVSRPPEQVVAEVRELASRGYREVVLLGQNVNSYGKRLQPPLTFAELLKKVNAVEGIERIRFITSHPWDAVEELFQAMGELEHVCEHLHLPVQSGSDGVLQRMRRGYTAEEYLEKLRLLRRILPGVAVTTDLIVGFPGETEEDFEATVRLVQEAQFDSAFIFTYSPRPFAAASRWEDDVVEEVKSRRLQRLLALQEEISRRRAQRLIGEEVEVLVESEGIGRTRTNRKVYFPGDSAGPGDLVQVRVGGVRGQSLVGTVAAAILGILALLSIQGPGLGTAFGAEDPSGLQAAFLRGEYDTVVIDTGRQLREGTGRADELLYLHGVSALKLRDWETARSSLERLVGEYPKSSLAPHAWLAMGDSWAASGDAGKAAEIYAQVVSEKRAGPLVPQALFRLGKAQRNLGQWEEAHRSFERLIQEAPGSAEAAWAREVLDQREFFFTVQVGAFVSRANAAKLESELRRRGYETELSETSAQGRIFHRVRVGRFQHREEAQAQAELLQKEGFPAKVFP